MARECIDLRPGPFASRNLEDKKTLIKSINDDLEARILVLESELEESRKREKRLRQGEEKLRSILESIEDEYYEVDLNGSYTFVNQAACRNHGYTREELLGLNYQQWTTPEEAKRLHHIFREVYRTGIPARLITYEEIRKDGSVVILEDTVSLLKDQAGKPIGFSGIARNVTEKIKIERALGQSEEGYRSLLETAPDAIAINRLKDGLYMEVNRAYCQQTGYTVEETIGRTVFDLSLYVDPEERQQLLRPLKEEGRVDGLEMRYRDKDGKINHYLVSATTLRFKGEECLLVIATNINAIKKTQQALQESEKKYRTILEGMEEGYYEIDLRGNFTFFNESECRIHGFSFQEMKGLNIRDLSPPDTSRKVSKIYHQIYKTGVPAKIIDYEIICKDGSKKILETSASLLKHRAGNPVGFYGISRDVTERKKIEKALRESEGKYRNILDKMEEVYVEVDLAGNMTFFNPAMCKSFGRSPEEMLGLNYREYTTEEGAAKLFSIFNHVFETGIPNQLFEFEVLRTDGDVRLLEGSVSLLRNTAGEPVGFHGIMRDRTGRKKAELALRESEEKYRLLVENANDGICILQDGTVKFSNPRTMELTGFTKAELTQRPFVSLVEGKDQKTFLKDQEETGAQTRSHTYIFRMTNRQNERLWVELNSISIIWEGRPATLNFLRDITPQKKMEAQFFQAQKMEAVGTLAGGIAHDFNNLLMGIQGNASLSLLDIGSDHPFYGRLKNIEHLVQAGAELTKQLLGTARGGKYEVKPIDINQLMEVSSDLFGRTHKDIVIHRYLQDGIWTVEVDRSQMEQVLLNLYVNAGHAMPGGGDLYLETKNIVLNENYTRPFGVAPGPFVRISVTDTGIGMAESVRKRVFDPFFTTKEMGRGTGLGLASAYGIIKNHNGIITVDSEPGEGTTFTISLPTTKKEMVAESPMKREIFNGSETILLVDDEEAIVQVGKALLERLGYRIIIARSGQEAIAIFLCQSEPMDLVILDMIMPGLNGSETYDKLRAIHPAVKVLLCSGYSLNGEAKAILDRGCQGFIQKPFSLAEISKRVRQILDG
jgi:two-component system, cell cycle sensor histidine kinase and response regulator CckA